MTSENTTSNQPTHSVYQVLENEGQKPFWMKIGAAWENRDGKGMNVRLDALPINGRIVIRANDAQTENPAGAQ